VRQEDAVLPGRLINALEVLVELDKELSQAREERDHGTWDFASKQNKPQISLLSGKIIQV
jgi:hypothetical protein